MVSQTVEIVNKLGMHARPSAMLVSTASQFASAIYLTKGTLRVNGKSIMGVMMLAAEKGATVKVEADGEDEEAALAAVVKIILSGFGEEI